MGLLKRVKGAAINAALGAPGRRAIRLVHNAQTALGKQARQIELYYQVDDPYSHLLAQVLPRLRRRYPVDVQFLLAPPPGPDVDPAPESRAVYAARDARLLAERYDVDFPAEAPAPDRGLVELANAVLAQRRQIDEQLAAATAVGAALWRGDRAAMAEARQRFGASPERVEEALHAGDNRRSANRHYMSGMLFYRGEWFWGLDRLHYLESRLTAEHDFPAGDSVLIRRPARQRAAATAPDPGRSKSLDFYFSYRSPYSYLALARTFRLADRYGLDLHVKPVLPMVMRGMPVPSPKRLYIAMDCKREAERLGLPFGHICDPVGRGVERCLAVQQTARAQGKERELLTSACRGIWAESLDVAVDRDLRKIADRADLSWDDCRRALEDEHWREQVERNREDLFALGLWGVPCFRLGDFTTWGQDRLEILDDHLRRSRAM